ncbi:lyase family protein, partial [Vibrio parahaemolyticus]|nr:lyase family protein [Vibrio parahaemolyticus]
MSEEAKKSGANTMWGGRFSSSPSALMEAINASIGFDKRLASQDIQGSIAHSAMLANQGNIAESDRDAIHQGLQRVLGENESGSFTFPTALEDNHMNVES